MVVVVTDTYNPSYSGVEIGRITVKTSLGKKFVRAHLNQKKKKLGVLAYACHPSYKGSTNRRINVQTSLGIK
jgi:hypothetical protein